MEREQARRTSECSQACLAAASHSGCWLCAPAQVKGAQILEPESVTRRHDRAWLFPDASIAYRAFERFIGAARNEPPDIDVDFEHERREEVIQYYENTGATGPVSPPP